MKIWTKIGQLLGRAVPKEKSRFWTFLRGMALGADPTRVFGRPVSISSRLRLPRRSLTVWEQVGADMWNAIEVVDRELRGGRSRD